MNKIIESASKYLGMTETTNRVELTNLVGVDVKTTPWCAAFVNAILKENGIVGSGSNLARSFLTRFKVSPDPTVGDIVVLKRGNSSWQGHVGFLAEPFREGDSRVVLLGGNQNDCVCIAKFPISQLLGFRSVR